MAFLEEYTLLDELGQGGYATVYKVRHNKLGYIRAIRVLNAIIAHGEDDKTYQKFLEECRLLLRLGNGNQPNIVHIYQPLLRAQRAIVEMDYVDGVDLFHFLEKNSSFVETGDVLKLLSDIGGALAYCHEEIYKFCMDKDEDELKDNPNDGSKLLIDEEIRQRLIKKYRVIHNDIHSGNIIRREDGNYVLLDFGLAIEGDSVVRSSRRKNGAPEFKAPEKWDNDSILTPQSDIYSFGVVLYEFLTGRVPFLFNKQNSNPTEAEYLLSKAHKEQQPESIFDLRKEAFERIHPGEEYEQDYPQWLENVIMKCLAKNPEDRYVNGKELFDEIKRYSQEANSSCRQESIDERNSLNEEIRNLTEENASLRDQLNDWQTLSSDNNNEITALQNKLTDSKRDLDKAGAEILRLNEIIKTTPAQTGKKWKIATFVFAFMALLISIIALNVYYNMKGSLINYWDHESKSYRAKVDSLQSLLNNGGQSAAIANLRQQIQDKNNHISDLQNRIQELENSIKEFDGGNNDNTIRQLRGQVSSLEEQVQTYRNRIATLESSNKNTIQYENTIKALNAQINNLKNQIADKDKEIQVLKTTYVNGN